MLVHTLHQDLLRSARLPPFLSCCLVAEVSTKTNNIILYDVYIIRLLIYYAKFILLVFIQLDHGGKTFMISTNTNLQYNLCRLRQDLKNY